ncbi:MAG: phosphate signaling complex protein PhoU [Steroidobacteraceae bacterium]
MDSTRSGDPVEGHTLRSVDQALADLRLRTLVLGSLVMDQVDAAASALLTGERDAAEKVLAREPRVNELTRQIDHRAFEAIALRQLVAVDLRLARAISRIVVDLERAGDECKKLARIALRQHPSYSAGPLTGVAAQLRRMADLAGAMLRNALLGLDEAALEPAAAVAAQDRELDREFSAALHLLLARASADAAELSATIDAVFAAKSLERIGDHAKNMAEQVESYLVGDPPESPLASLEPL